MGDVFSDVDFTVPSSRLGCALCELELTTVRRYLDGLSYENVNDVEVRASLRASRGLCIDHAWQFLDVIHDSLGVAIIYRDILATILANLRALVHDDPVSRVLRRLVPSSMPAERVAREALQKLRPRVRCPACQALDIALAERGYNTAYLCLPHLRTVASSGRLSAASVSAAWAQTMHRLRRFASDEASDGQYSRRGWNAESSRGCLLDLAETAFGRPGIVRTPPRSGRPIVGDDRPSLVSSDSPAPAAGSEGCPVCARLSHDVTKMVDASAQRYPDLLRSLIEADDRCNVHAWQALDLRGGPAEARRYPLLQSDLDWVERCVTRLDDFNECRVCSFLEQRELDYCLAWEHDIVTPVNGDRTRTSTGSVCLPHLMRTLQLVPSDTAGTLVRHVIAPLQRLHVDLSEYIRKEDYRFRGEPKGNEQSAPVRALATIAGPRWLI